MTVRIGLIDSGVGEALFAHVVSSRRFDDLPGYDPAQPDDIGHGDSLARLVLQLCPEAELLVAQVFHDQGCSPISRVAEALDWLAAEGAQVVNMSLGLAVPAVRLNEACRAAAGRGMLLVASAPATGGIVFPAALPECLAVTGDARCAAEDLAWLGQPHAELGACPLVVPGQVEQGGGASFACARVTGLAGRLITRQGIPPSEVAEHLRRNARYIGREERRA